MLQKCRPYRRHGIGEDRWWAHVVQEFIQVVCACQRHQYRAKGYHADLQNGQRSQCHSAGTESACLSTDSLVGTYSNTCFAMSHVTPVTLVSYAEASTTHQICSTSQHPNAGHVKENAILNCKAQLIAAVEDCPAYPKALSDKIYTHDIANTGCLLLSR